MINKKQIKKKLNKIEELESEAHKIYDQACGSLMYSSLSDEKREKRYKETYKATKKHAEAMELVRELQDKVAEMLSSEAEILQN